MSQLRSDLWCAAFVRKHNDLGEFCVIARKGDPIAGQIWIEVDHLDGTVTLFAPAPSLMAAESGDQTIGTDRLFQTRISAGKSADVRSRLEREAEFDPDFWHISLETRRSDVGLTVVKPAL